MRSFDQYVGGTNNNGMGLTHYQTDKYICNTSENL